jgi:GNAT superfamily N-acetyltransferase
MDVRPYLPADRDGCLAVFDSNTPDFCRLEDRPDFEEVLDGREASYFAMEHAGAIVGCGGYSPGEPARLVWGMVHRDWQRQGLGRFLLLFRLREISKAGGVKMVHVETPLSAARFFEGQGFRMVGEGVDVNHVVLAKKLTVCP